MNSKELAWGVRDSVGGVGGPGPAIRVREVQGHGEPGLWRARAMESQGYGEPGP